MVPRFTDPYPGQVEETGRGIETGDGGEGGAHGKDSRRREAVDKQGRSRCVLRAACVPCLEVGFPTCSA
ncbi:hypothetical protein CKAH01_01567 [Colletotrichum kahawae]|uniref:Uncharacterized protein n=1 Tax=Colletotrichum kahawae TaxID=34407 RepID=A0AAD9Y6D6_COLKA|nr:hypothetical protein CKAH01_01567 [Colletotrichum kahawae]